MRHSRFASWVSCLILLGATACSLPASLGNPSPTPSPLAKPTRTATQPAPPAASPTAGIAALSTATSSPSAAPPAASSTPGAQSAYCSDGQVQALISSFKSAILTSNGPLLATLVSSTHGMDARLFRNGRVVNYDPEHAKFLFASTFVVDWGLAPASGLDTQGSFHDLIVPALADVFSKSYTLSCNQVKVGGTTYTATWPYPGINFYSVFYPGTTANGNMDWHTWLIGTDYAGSKPYLYAIMQFYWEP